MNRIKAFISQESWSPYIAGIMLGIVGLLTVLLANTLLGASGAFESIVGLIGKKITPSIFSNIYWGVEGGRALPIIRPEITWSVILLVGIILGGTLAAFTSRSFKFRLMMMPNGNASLVHSPGNVGYSVSLVPSLLSMEQV